MFQSLDRAIPLDGGLSWYEVGKAFWCDNGARKRGQQQEILKTIVEWLPSTDRPAIAWTADRIRDKSPRELLTWLQGYGNFHFALADYYKRKLAGEEPRLDVELRLRCMRLHGYDANEPVYTLCIWPLITDLLKDFKKSPEDLWSDED